MLHRHMHAHIHTCPCMSVGVSLCTCLCIHLCVRACGCECMACSLPAAVIASNPDTLVLNSGTVLFNALRKVVGTVSPAPCM